MNFNISELFQEKVNGLSIELNSNREFQCTGLTLQKEKKDVKILKTFSQLSNIEELSGELDSNSMTSLVLNGKGILNKVISTSSFNSENFFNESFNQSDKDSFYYQSYFLNNDRVSVSIIRKTQLDTLIAKLAEEDIKVCAIILGNEIVTTLFNIFPENFHYTFIGIGQKISFQENGIENLESTDAVSSFTTEIDGHDLNPGQLLSLSATMHHFFPDQRIIELEHLEVQGKVKNHSIERFSNKMILAMACFVFLLLTVNTLAFINFNEKVSYLKDVMAQNERYIDLEQKLKSEVDSKNKALQNTSLKTIRSSIYADQISASIPNGIILTRLEIFPRTNPSNKKETVKHNFSVIEIEGQLEDYSELNKMISSLNEIEWIEDIELVSFEKIENGGSNNFSLILDVS